MITARPVLCVVATIVVALNLGCASTNGAPTQADLDGAIRARTAAMGIRLERQEPLPPDVDLTDGLTQEEAVAVALWNSPSFQATLTDLGIARADLAQQGCFETRSSRCSSRSDPSNWSSRCSIRSRCCGSVQPVSRPLASMRRRSANGSSGMRSRWSHRSEARTPMRSPLTVAWRWPHRMQN